MAQSVLPDSQVFVLEGYDMTNTPISEREKELLGTAKAVRNTLRLLYGERPTNLGNLMKDLNRVIAAYDPKPEPVPVIPAWEIRADHLKKLIIQLQEQVARLNAWQIQQNNTELRRQMANQGSSKAPTE